MWKMRPDPRHGDWLSGDDLRKLLKSHRDWKPKLTPQSHAVLLQIRLEKYGIASDAT